MTEYYFERLSPIGKNFYRKVIQAAESWKATVTGSPLLSEMEFRNAIYAVNYDHPELFHVNFIAQNYSHDYRGYTLQLRYLYSQTVARLVKARVESVAESVLNAARACLDKPRYVQYRFLHNQLLKLAEYDYATIHDRSANVEAYTIVGVFQNHSAVCEGIAKAFKYLCDNIGLFCILITGKSFFAQAGVEVEHAWNLIQVDDGIAHIDVTWDMNASALSRSNRYDYFCIADEDSMVDHSYSGYPPALSSRYNYFVINKAVINGYKSLEAFLKAKMSVGSEVLYFKLRKSNRLTKTIIPHITETVEKIASSVYKNGYSITAVINEEQYIFFYRVAAL